MATRCLTVAAMIGALAGILLAGEKPQDDKPGKPEKAASRVREAPSLEQLKTIVQPMLETIALKAEQKEKAQNVMSHEGWEATLEVFEKKRRGELLSLVHKKVPEIMPTIMMPRMMAYSMQKGMMERMARKAGPPTPKEIKAIRAATRARMRDKLAPAIMGKVEELTAERMEEVLLDRKTLVRALAESVSEAALTDKQTRKFNKMLTEAGYPKALVRGPDPVLMKRVNKMLEDATDQAIAELKKADNSGKRTEGSKE